MELDPGDEWRLRPVVDALRNGPLGQVWFGFGASDPADWARRIGELVGPSRRVATCMLRREESPWDAMSDARGGREVVVAWTEWGITSDDPFWQRMNLGRERRTREGWSIVLWVTPTDGPNALAGAAPDLWAHRAGVLRTLSTVHPFWWSVRGPWRDGLRRAVKRAGALGAGIVDRERLHHHLRLVTVLGDAPEQVADYLRVVETCEGTVRAEDVAHAATRLGGDGALGATAQPTDVPAAPWCADGDWLTPLLTVDPARSWVTGRPYAARMIGLAQAASAAMDTITGHAALGDGLAELASVGARAYADPVARVFDDLRSRMGVGGILVDRGDGVRDVPWTTPTPRIPRDSAVRVVEEARARLRFDPASTLRVLAQLSAVPRSVELFPEVDVGRFSVESPDEVEAALALLRDTAPPDAAPGPPLPHLVVDPAADVRAEGRRIEARARAALGNHDAALAAIQSARDWYAAHDWPAGARIDCELDFAEILLLRPDVPRADELLRALPTIDRKTVADEARSARKARAEARVHLASGRPVDAYERLRLAGEAATLPAIRWSIDLDIAGLPPEAAPWEVRATSVRRVRDAAAAALLVVAEGRALAIWARLLREVGRDEEAVAARADARWIADRIPDRLLVAELAVDHPGP